MNYVLISGKVKITIFEIQKVLSLCECKNSKFILHNRNQFNSSNVLNFDLHDRSFQF